MTEIVVHIDELLWEQTGGGPNEQRLAGLIEASLERLSESPSLPSQRDFGGAEARVAETVAVTIRDALRSTQV